MSEGSLGGAVTPSESGGGSAAQGRGLRVPGIPQSLGPAGVEPRGAGRKWPPPSTLQNAAPICSGWGMSRRGEAGGRGRAAAWLIRASLGSPGLLPLTSPLASQDSALDRAGLQTLGRLPLLCCRLVAPPRRPPSPQAEGSCPLGVRPGARGQREPAPMDQRSPTWPALLPGESLGRPRLGRGFLGRCPDSQGGRLRRGSQR